MIELGMPDKSSIALLTISYCLMATAISGCGGADVSTAEETRSFQALSVLYGKYRGAHSGRIPPNKEDFVKYATKHEASLLQQFGIKDPNELIVSPRGGQPLVIVTGNKTLSGNNPIIAYEGEATAGKRIVVRSYGAVEEIEEATFQREVPGE